MNKIVKNKQKSKTIDKKIVRKSKGNFDKKLLNFANKLDSKLQHKTSFFRVKQQYIIGKLYNFVKNRFGYTRFVVEGLNKTKLLDILKKYEILDPVVSSNLTFKVKGKYRQDVIKILNDYNYKFTENTSSYVFSFVNFICSKKLATFVLLLVCIFYLYTNLLVLKIDINNCYTDVSKILVENNIKVGSYLNNIDTTKLERLILNKLDISFCDIKIVGNTLKINITPSSSANIVDKPDINKVIIATCDCILSRQLIYSGTSYKKFGDVIKKGEILVFNHIVANENDKIKTFASGDIYGLIQKNASIEIDKNTIEKVPTGNKKTITNIAFNGKFRSTKPPYKIYEKEEKINKISDILPLFSKTTTYTEYTYKTVIYNKNMVIEKYLDSLTKQLVNDMPYTAKYKRRFYFISETASKYILDCYIEYEDKVSTLSSY